MARGKIILVTVVLAATAGMAPAQEAAPAKKLNRLLTAKMIAVTPMPGEFDRWITQDLKAWNRYDVSSEAEGSDLIVRGEKPERQVEFKQHEGVPQPKREKPGPGVLSITVIDWVADQPLWHATIRDKKPEKDKDTVPGPDVEIDAHGLNPMELAAVITRQFRLYVEQLEKSGQR